MSRSCWIITEGIAGTENPCIGLAESMGLTPVVKRVRLCSPWRQLTPYLRWGHLGALTADSDPVSPPWPDILITSGRKAVGLGLEIKRASRGQTFLVHVQDPKINPRHFDLVIAPQHDDVRGDNVVLTTAGLNRITDEKLKAARQHFEKSLRHLPRPRVAVLIGGSTRKHDMTLENARALSLQLLQLSEAGAGLMITASRRTGEENTHFLRESLKGDNIFFWDGTGDNPYHGFLALADYIVVTEDSVSMTSEALATGKPVYIASLEGGARRLDLFHKKLQEQGYTRPFTGVLEEWSYTPPGDTERAAAEVMKKILITDNKCELTR